MEIFSKLPDPRSENSCGHKLFDIIFTTPAAVVCGAESWNDIESFGNARIDWPKRYLELPNGIPVHDTFNRFFAALDTKKLNECFVEWVNPCKERTNGDIVSIDGKCIKGASKKGAKSFITLVSGWSKSSGVCLGQVKTSDKSNEITAIPELLELLELKSRIVTIDAAGCQTVIAGKVRDKNADYVLAVKGNQGTLKEGIEGTVKFSEACDSYVETDCDHGRIETRKREVYDDLSFLANVGRWKDFRSLIRISSKRTEKSTEKTTRETRLYIASLKPDAKKLLEAIRSHWGIENSLHWSLDVTFDEDRDRKRAGNAAENFSI